MNQERQKGHDAGALDGLGDNALMFHAGTATPSGNDFAVRRDKPRQEADVFVVDLI